MTASIAGFARSIPEATPTAGDAAGAAAAPTEGTESFGSALATALADEGSRGTGRGGRTRREPRTDERAPRTANGRGSGASRTEESPSPTAAIREDAPSAHPGRALGLIEGNGLGLEHASPRALAVLAALVEGASGEGKKTGEHGTAGVKPSARPVPSIPIADPSATPVLPVASPAPELVAAPVPAIMTTLDGVADAEQLLDIAYGVAAEMTIEAPLGELESADAASEPPADASLAERFVEAAASAVTVEGSAPVTAAASPNAHPASAIDASAIAASAVVASTVPPTASTRTESAPAPVATTSARRSTEALVPEMRIRLERVIERMESEFGYKVEVVETVRSQARQDELFAQGRTAPGPVVTWTRNSKHIAGRAVDVMIDGSYGNAEAYRHLAQVAEQEGLKSLWPRDGGHLELRGKGATPIPALSHSGFDPASGTASERSALGRGADGIPAQSKIPSSAADVALPFGAAVRDEGSAVTGAPARFDATTTQRATGPGAQQDGFGSAVRVRETRGFARVAEVASVAHVSQVARVASVASVAPVAQVAAVAQVAPLARVASVAQVAALDATSTGDGSAAPGIEVPGRGEGGASAASGTPSTAAMPNAISSDAGAANGQRQASDSRRERERGEALLAALDARGAQDDGSLARSLMGRETAGTTGSASGAFAETVAGLSRTDATERIARVLKMQEAAGDRPLSSVLLRLDAPDGGEDRIRIDLRGTSVGASFDVSDPRAADNLRSHTRELQHALERQGLEADSLVVRTTQRTTEPASLASAVSAEREAGRIGSTAASDGGGSTAKDSRNQSRADDWREGASHHRSRQQRQGGKDSR